MNPEKSDTSTSASSTRRECWYRVESKRYAVYDGFGDHYFFTPPEVQCRAYAVEKHTPKGVRLRNGRVVLHSTKKQWASPTIEQATAHFIARRRAEEKILRSKLLNCEIALQNAIDGNVKVFDDPL